MESNKKRPSGDRAKQNAFAKKALLWTAALLLLAAVLLLGAKAARAELLKARVEQKRALVERELHECAELVLYKMRYSDIITIKKRGALSRAFSIVRYSGIIRAGIEDAREIEFEMSADGKSVLVKIPPSVLLGNDISSQEVFDEQQRLFTRIGTQEVFDQIEEGKRAAADDFLADGLLDDADERAKQVVAALLRPLGFDSIAVELK